MTLAASKSVSRAKDGKIYGWSGSYVLTSGGVTLLSYTNPSAFYLTRVTLGVDWSSISAGEVIRNYSEDDFNDFLKETYGDHKN